MPVTGIICAIAVLAAVLNDRDAVVMSNEWSASVPTLEHNGQQVNHQWSKSAAFEASFRELLAASQPGLPDYLLGASRPDRAVGRGEVRRADAVPPDLPQL